MRVNTRIIEFDVNKVLAVIIVVGVCFNNAIILYHGVSSNLDGVVLGRILGTLDNALMLVLGYYFGSSKSSADKTKIIEQQANPTVAGINEAYKKTLNDLPATDPLRVTP